MAVQTKRAVKKSKKVALDVTKYKRELKREMKAILDVIEEEWGFRPELEVTVAPAIRVHADFNLKGFAHKGGGTWIHPGNRTKRSPRKVARDILRELVAHRNTCRECGEGIAPLYLRQQVNDMQGSYLHHYVDPNEPRIYNGHGRQLALDVLPDAVEKLLFPLASAKAEIAITKAFGEGRTSPSCPLKPIAAK